MDEAPRVPLRDRLLVEWVANAKVGDPFPEPWSNAMNPRESIIRTLVMLRVIPLPAPDANMAAVAQEASVAARAWLEQHPP
ncbi:MAG TPA: hypothetical protein VNA28_09730 [Solirubrobacteraceae bacterium]|nr:hypothetical protein [Solirubrobacteraceae bacterium]